MLSFLVPLFFLGAGLLSIPWLIHRIRRDEKFREKFGAFMFVPKIEHAQMRRSRIDHWLLMLMRMGLIVLLFLAFARPVLRLAREETSDQKPLIAHIIAVDRSFSMGADGVPAGDRFGRAKIEAKKILDGIGPDDAVGLIAFDRTAEQIVSLEAREVPAGFSRGRIEQRIDELALSFETTRYVPVLQLAEASLEAYADADTVSPARTQLIVHLISDFQRSGMPGPEARWRLSPRVSLRTYDTAAETPVGNRAIVDAVVRRISDEQIRVVSKIQNWSEDDRVGVTLLRDGRSSQDLMLRVPEGHSRTAIFDVSLGRREDFKATLRLSPYGLQVDNVRTVAYSSPLPTRIYFLTPASIDDGEGGADWYLRAAVDKKPDGAWEVERISTIEKAASIARAGQGELMVVPDAGRLGPDYLLALARFIETGGSALIALGAAASDGALEDNLLKPMGLTSGATNALGSPSTSPSAPPSRAAIDWVDLAHPAFTLFRGSRYNDFSQLRAVSPLALSFAGQSGEGSAMGPRVLARFEPSGDSPGVPAMIEVRRGAGKAIVWAFDPGPSGSNFTKSIKFVPLVQEMLAYLRGAPTQRVRWTVGDKFAPPDAPETGVPWKVEFRGSEYAARSSAERSVRDRVLDRPGFIFLYAGDEARPRAVYTVNLDASESNLERIAPEELVSKLSASEIPGSGEGRIASEGIGSDETGRNGIEIGLAILAVMFAGLIVEGWYAGRLAR